MSAIQVLLILVTAAAVSGAVYYWFIMPLMRMHHLKRYICIAGQSGVGKETVYKLLKKRFEKAGYTTSVIHFSDPVNETLDIWGFDRSRINQQVLSLLIRNGVWEDKGIKMPPEWAQASFCRVVYKRAIRSSANFVFIDGVRRPADIGMIKSLPGLILIAVCRDDLLCLEGIRKRNDRPGDAEKSLEQFQTERQADSERLIGEICKTADIAIHNNFMTVEELDKSLNPTAESILKSARK